MQPYRIARCVPRVCKPATTPSRNMFTAPFFPHFGPDFAPLIRLIDSATADFVPAPSSHVRHSRRSFQPRFDVREVGANYELQGELPGIEQKDLEIEFVDEKTLVIRGKTARESTATTNANADSAAATLTEPDKAVAANEEAAADTSDKISEHSANYQKPSVEEEDYVDAGAESSADGAKGPSSPATVTADASPAAVESRTTAEPTHKYWVSERSVGEFERRFSFPGRVDQETVKASLKNGILSVVVPKIVAKEARRIQIE